MAVAYKIVHWLCRIGLAGIFFYSGYTKIKAPLEFAASLSAYQLFPAKLIFPIADYFPWIEILLAIALLIGWKIRYVALAVAGVLCFFLCILAITYFRGIEADCGCFGSGDRISPRTLARDFTFLLPALFLILEPRIRMWRRARPET
ncbi:MAG: DoxX family protein [Acidobacteria bacterium]|nr:DoxX family protein [Acidobacteriota bacterium]